MENPPLLMRRQQVFAMLGAVGLSGYQVRVMLEDGTIPPVRKRRANERARYSRRQIEQDVLANLLADGGAQCDTSQSAETREVKAKSKEGSNG